MEKMKKKNCLLILTVMLLMLGFGTCRVYGAGTITVKVPVRYDQTEARRMLDIMNDFRTGTDGWAWNESNTEKIWYNDLKPLTYDYELEQIAMQRAAETAIHFSHTRPNGTKWFTAYNGNYGFASENLAGGNSTSERTFVQWAEEDEDYDGQGHRRNMLSRSAVSVGIGHVVYQGVHYWVQEFRNFKADVPVVPADDSARNVSVEVAENVIRTLEGAASPSSYNISCGARKALPDVGLNLLTTEGWPQIPRSILMDGDMSVSWQSENSEIASIESGVVIGKKAGSTNIVTTVLNKTLKVPVTVSPTSIEGAKVQLSDTRYVYDGKEKKPEIVSVKVGDDFLSDSDYTVTYSNRTEVGKASITLEGKGDYTGRVTVQFEIIPKDISSGTLRKISPVVYTGREITPVIEVILNGYNPVEGTDYQVKCVKNIDAGEAEISVIGKGNYTGTIAGNFLISPRSIAECSLFSIEDQEYSGQPVTPDIRIEYKGKALILNKDYQLTYDCNMQVGTGKILVEGMGNFEGEITATFKIIGCDNHEWILSGTQAATVFKEGKRTYICRICKETRTETIARLKPILKLNTTALTMQIKQTTSGLKPIKMQKGDAVVSYSSSNSRIVKITNKKKGTMKALKAGTANVTVKLKSGKTAKCKIKVQKGKVETTGIQIAKKSITMKKGGRVSLGVSLVPFTSQSGIKYKSSNAKIVTVTSKGVARGIKKGKAKITIESSKKKVICTITVK